MHITLRQLEIFTTIYQQLSTTGASKQLNLSQSAVSTGLQELEKQLDVRLFERVNRRLYTTEEAHQLYHKATALLESTHEIETLFKQHRTIINIGASSTIGNYLLPNIMADFRQHYPNTDFRLCVANSREILQQTANFQHDIALIEASFTHADLDNLPWQQDELVFVASPNSKWLNNSHNIDDILPLSFLSEVDLIMRESGSGTREALDKFLLNNLSHHQVSMELGNSEAIKQAVRNDLGIGCLSRHVVQDELNAGQLRLLNFPISITRPLWIIRHKQKHIGSRLQQFSQFLIYPDT